jgi:hypothetical protein
LAAYVSEQSGASGNLQMTTATLEVLACIAFRQPISQAEIDLMTRKGFIASYDGQESERLRVVRVKMAFSTPTSAGSL